VFYLFIHVYLKNWAELIFLGFYENCPLKNPGQINITSVTINRAFKIWGPLKNLDRLPKTRFKFL